jgi:hypothetical protein
MTDKLEPNTSVYQALPTFMCGSGGCNVTVNYQIKPEREIAGNFLEEIGSWMTALEREGAPGRVMLGVRAAYDAALWWVTDLDKPRPTPPAGHPRRTA